MKLTLESLVFNNPFKVVRTGWNSSAQQSNQNHNGKISKAVPATFKINRLKYSGGRLWYER